MLSHSYFILGPNGPEDTQSAAITQRHTIPLVWALLTGAEGARLVADESKELYYFALNVDDGLKLLDRGMASWNYNRYFRATLAPVGVFRTWLADYPPETPIYINIAELIRRSPTPVQDVESLTKLGSKVREALGNIEDREFTHFINDLRALAFPFITVPITGDRERDVYILTYEVRDTASIEAEMALQMVGVDRGKSLLREATASIPTLLPHRVDTEEESEITARGQKRPSEDDSPFTTVYAPYDADLRTLFVEHLGMHLERETPRFCYFEKDGERLKVVKLAKPIVREVEARVEET